MTDNYKLLRALKKDIEGVIVRQYLRSQLTDYEEEKTYVIYDGKDIAELNESILEFKIANKEIEFYYISKPVKALLK